jgi:hypothetical protein
MKKYFIRMALTAIAVTAFIGCRKEERSSLTPVVISKEYNTVQDTVNDTIIDASTYVYYVVNVIPGGNATGGGSKVGGLEGATVTCVSNGVQTTVQVGADGQAAFPKLSRGNVTVSVSAANHTTLSYTVTLKDDDDFTTVPVNEVPWWANNMRYASTMVVLFPTAGAGTAEIKGRAFADLNEMLIGNEPVSGIKVTAVLNPGTQLRDFVNHMPNTPGNVLNVMYENMVVSGTTDINGNYSLVVPATGKDLVYRVMGDDFAYDVITGANTVERKVFSHGSKTATITSNVTRVVDLDY